MKIPKCLTEYAQKHKLIVVPIRYKHQFGYCKRKGFDLVNPLSKEIIASFEPTQMQYYSTKWTLRHVHENYTGRKEFDRLCPSVLKDLKPTEKSYFHLNFFYAYNPN